MKTASTFNYKKGDQLNGYSIVFPIKRSLNAETYRAKTTDGSLCFLKIFDTNTNSDGQYTAENNLLEIQCLKRIKHNNISGYLDSGIVKTDFGNQPFLVLEFVSGETLAERLLREPYATYVDVKNIILQVLDGLNYLHHLPNPIIHNEITPHNIMLDISGGGPRAVIIDFGNARTINSDGKGYHKFGLNLNFVATECLSGYYSPQSDIFSAGAVFYHMLFGLPPWFKGFSGYNASQSEVEEQLIMERFKPLHLPDISKKIIGINESVNLVIKKALSRDLDIRFKSISEFVSAVKGNIEIEDVDAIKRSKSIDGPVRPIPTRKVTGKGFKAVAGMDALKQELQEEVIDALQNPEEYSKYGISIPNGMLLYGPPGCGKTFFATHFAEEVGYNFIHVKPGNLKSKYVNATEENIAKLFEDAADNAPTIIYIDEISGLFPSRDSDAHEMSKNAVEAMLAEMDRTGEKGIFVICATNYPDKIDTALLRSGRLDKKVYLPPPDHNARRALFELYLKERPVDSDLDLDELARLTENYVSSDIKEVIINPSARIAMRNKGNITMEILRDVISKTKPSVPLDELKKYDLMKAKMDGEQSTGNNTRNPIGFR
jgi:transitional endoplasmic reticulum ATPase